MIDAPFANCAPSPTTLAGCENAYNCLLELDGEDLAALPLVDRKTRLAALLEKLPNGIAFSAHETCDGEAFRRAACRHGLESVVSKRIDRRYLPDDRGAWIKSKCLNRGEFVIVGWSDPEGSRPFLGSLLLAYHDDDGRSVYAGRVGTGMSQKMLALLHRRLASLGIHEMPLAVPPPRETRFGGRLALSKVDWVRPELVARSPIWPGPRTACFATRSSSACATTSPPAKSGASARPEPRRRRPPALSPSLS